MAKTDYIEVATGERFPILYEDRSVIAIDKPVGWMLVPFSWQDTQFNLQAAVTSSIAEGAFWARCRNLKMLRYVHRLDGETSGVHLWGKSTGAVEAYSELFENRKMSKTYLAVVAGEPGEKEWTCELSIAPDKDRIGAVRVDDVEGKDAITHFRLLATRKGMRGRVVSLLECRPVTGRTHQIRVHAAAAGHPVVEDPLYGDGEPDKRLRGREGIGLRACQLAYQDPFQRRPVVIQAPWEEFLIKYGFEGVETSMGKRR